MTDFLQIGIFPSLKVWKALLVMYLKCRSPEKAVSIWEKYLKAHKSCLEDQQLWNLYLTASLQARHSKEHIAFLLQSMASQGVEVLPWGIKSVVEYKRWLEKKGDHLQNLLDTE
jgi:hypothetical protein